MNQIRPIAFIFFVQCSKPLKHINIKKNLCISAILNAIF